MGKNQKSDHNGGVSKSTGGTMKVTKRTRKSVPRDSPSQRSSVYRGVTRHRWTGRYEAHLWDKNCWNESQNKKGKQVYLGAYDDEEAAAHAYDLAALKYWGHTTILNFPLSTYQEELKEMEGQSKEEYIGSLRRKSNGFSRGVSKYRGVARHHHNGRWEARIGRVFGNKYLYLGTYATQEEAATAYDMAALEYRGLNAVTNFDLSRYINWLRPNSDVSNCDRTTSSGILSPSSSSSNNNNNATTIAIAAAGGLGQGSFFQQQHGQFMRGEMLQYPVTEPPATMTTMATPPALELLLESQKFEEAVERTPTTTSSPSFTWPSPPPLTLPPMSDATVPRPCSFPDEVQTYFECINGGGGFMEEDDAIFGDLNDLMSPIFQFELDFLD